MSSSVIKFIDNEVNYENWCNTNRNGYVFNRAGGSTGNVLHKVDCWHLKVPSRKGTYTTRYPKYCSENLNDILVGENVVNASINIRI